MPRFEQNGARISGSNPPTPKTVAVVSGWLAPENQAMPVLFEHVVDASETYVMSQVIDLSYSEMTLAGTESQVRAFDAS